MASYGGKREGAGRKKAPHTLSAEKSREYLINRIAVELDPIVTAQIEAAKGMYVEDAEKKVYRKTPDLKAGEYLLNQAVGKAKETMELGGKDGDPIPVNLIVSLDKIYGKKPSN